MSTQPGRPHEDPTSRLPEEDIVPADAEGRLELDPEAQVNLPDQPGHHDSDVGLREDDPRDTRDNPEIEEVAPPD